VVVEADERCVRIGLRHQNRRSAVTATDICDSRALCFETWFDTVQRRYPVADQMGCIARAEEPFGSLEQ
jgi:hypothetical protein